MNSPDHSLNRRNFIKRSAAFAAATFIGPWKYNQAHASTRTKPITIGFTADETGRFGNSGHMERLGMQMALEEFNQKGGLLGRKLNWIHQDTETNSATGIRIAEKFITRHEVNFLIGAVSADVSSGISKVAQKYGTIYLNTNSSSPDESGKNCHRVKFSWDANGDNFARAIVESNIQSLGKKWVLLNHDYDWGRETSHVYKHNSKSHGINILSEILIPKGTQDFTPYLESIKKLNPDVVASAFCGDHLKALRTQVKFFGLHNKPVWINSQQDWSVVYGLPKGSLFGIFGTTWYHGLDLPRVKEFVKKYQQNFPAEPVRVPGNVFYNGYMATHELLSAVERVGTVNNIAVI